VTYILKGALISVFTWYILYGSFDYLFRKPHLALSTLDGLPTGVYFLMTLHVIQASKHLPTQGAGMVRNRLVVRQLTNFLLYGLRGKELRGKLFLVHLKKLTKRPKISNNIVVHLKKVYE
jgi:hypothetical protein